MATIEQRKRRISGKGESARYKPVYRVKIRIKGAGAIHRTFERKTDAERFIQSTEAAIRDGRQMTYLQSHRTTVGSLIDRYEHEILPQKPEASAINQKIHLDWWRSQLGHLKLSELSTPEISRCKQTLLIGDGNTAPKKPATVVRYLAALSHLLSIATREWQLLERNPIKGVSKPRVRNERTRYLNMGELSSLLSASQKSQNSYLYLVVALALTTGCRRGELMALTWDDVDLVRGTLTIQLSKNGEKRTIAISRACIALLNEKKSVTKEAHGFVFPRTNLGKSFSFRKSWELARARAGLKDFRFHDLRHSCASYLAMSGADRPGISVPPTMLVISSQA